MSDMYRLIFRGEVNDGQHVAVVKKRLSALLKLDDARAAELFSGKPVVIRKAADKATAVKFKTAFEQAGARLRIGRLEQPEPAKPAAGAAMSVLPVGSDVLTAEERTKPVEAEVDTSHLSVQGAVFTRDEPEMQIATPNVDHITLAEVGARIGDAADSVEEIVIETDFDLAEPGADLDVRDKPAPPPAPDTSHLTIEPDQ